MIPPINNNYINNTIAASNDPIARSKRAIPAIAKLLATIACANVAARGGRKPTPGKRPNRVTASFGSNKSGPKR